MKQALGRTRDTTFLGWALPVTQAHLWTAPQSGGETTCAAPLEKLSFAFRWANSVDPILHFDETHAQSESGKTVGNARENHCDRRMVCVAWKDRLIIWRTQEGSPGTALQPTILEALNVTYLYGLSCSEGLWLKKSVVELFLSIY